MFDEHQVTVMIPALNEAGSIRGVVRALPRDLVDEVVVVDNGSTDATVHEARRAGATVLYEPRRGYGFALMRALHNHGRRGVIVFMDGDGADDPEELPKLLAPLREGVDLIIGTRESKRAEHSATTWPQRLGNRLVTALIHGAIGHRYRDLGPYRAISADALRTLDMSHGTYGWTLEMQIKAVTRGLTVREVPVRHRRRRAGRSKVSGNARAIVKAGLVMPAAVLIVALGERVLLTPRRRHPGAHRGAGL